MWYVYQRACCPSKFLALGGVRHTCAHTHDGKQACRSCVRAHESAVVCRCPYLVPLYLCPPSGPLSHCSWAHACTQLPEPEPTATLGGGEGITEGMASSDAGKAPAAGGGASCAGSAGVGARGSSGGFLPPSLTNPAVTDSSVKDAPNGPAGASPPGCGAEDTVSLDPPQTASTQD
jgi:hypothetical protein